MSVISGILNADASSDAASTQADATNTATQTQMDQYSQTRADYAPWREAGTNALSQLAAKINAGPGYYTSSPGYNFRLTEGNKAIERSAAARGGVLSGATLKALNRFNQDYATNDYQNFLNNYYQSLTPYQSLAQVGQTSTGQLATLGANAANQIGQNAITAGNAQAAGSINTANSITGAMNSGINNYMLWKNLAGNSGEGYNVSPATDTSNALWAENAPTWLQ